MNATPGLEGDLNATIVNAVNARVEAHVLKALSGDEVIGGLVTAALQRQVEVPSSTGYGKERVPFMSHVIEQAIRNATKTAVEGFIAGEQEMIQNEVRKHLRKAAPEFAEKMVGQLVKTASSGYGIQVSLRTGG